MSTGSLNESIFSFLPNLSWIMLLNQPNHTCRLPWKPGMWISEYPTDPCHIWSKHNWTHRTICLSVDADKILKSLVLAFWAHREYAEWTADIILFNMQHIHIARRCNFDAISNSEYKGVSISVFFPSLLSHCSMKDSSTQVLCVRLFSYKYIASVWKSFQFSISICAPK